MPPLINSPRTHQVIYDLPYETSVAAASLFNLDHWAFIPPQDIELLEIQLPPRCLFDKYCSSCPFYSGTINAGLELAKQLSSNPYKILEQWIKDHSCTSIKHCDCPIGHGRSTVIHKKCLTAWNQTSYDIYHYAVEQFPAEDKKGRIRPYLIANTYSDGRVCWPNSISPADLRKAHSVFWNSSFNYDLFTPELEIYKYDGIRTMYVDEGEEDDDDECLESQEFKSLDWENYIFSEPNPIAVEYTFEKNVIKALTFLYNS